MTDCKFSFAPFGDPGSVRIRVLFLTPATGLDIMATDGYQSGSRRLTVIKAYRGSHPKRLRACHALPGVSEYPATIVKILTQAQQHASVLEGIQPMRYVSRRSLESCPFECVPDFGRDILLCKPCPTSCDNYIWCCCTIGPLQDLPLYFLHVVGHDTGPANIPLLAFLKKDISEDACTSVC